MIFEEHLPNHDDLYDLLSMTQPIEQIEPSKSSTTEEELEPKFDNKTEFF